jgi:hypothetical protein
MQRDIFGGFAVIKDWGRIGASGRVVVEWDIAEALAVTGAQKAVRLSTMERTVTAAVPH